MAQQRQREKDDDYDLALLAEAFTDHNIELIAAWFLSARIRDKDRFLAQLRAAARRVDVDAVSDQVVDWAFRQDSPSLVPLVAGLYHRRFEEQGELVVRLLKNNREARLTELLTATPVLFFLCSDSVQARLKQEVRRAWDRRSDVITSCCRDSYLREILRELLRAMVPQDAELQAVLEAKGERDYSPEMVKRCREACDAQDWDGLLRCFRGFSTRQPTRFAEEVDRCGILLPKHFRTAAKQAIKAGFQIGTMDLVDLVGQASLVVDERGVRWLTGR